MENYSVLVEEDEKARIEFFAMRMIPMMGDGKSMDLLAMEAFPSLASLAVRTKILEAEVPKYALRVFFGRAILSYPVASVEAIQLNVPGYKENMCYQHLLSIINAADSLKSTAAVKRAMSLYFGYRGDPKSNPIAVVHDVYRSVRYKPISDIISEEVRSAFPMMASSEVTAIPETGLIELELLCGTYVCMRNAWDLEQAIRTQSISIDRARREIVKLAVGMAENINNRYLRRVLMGLGSSDCARSIIEGTLRTACISRGLDRIRIIHELGLVSRSAIRHILCFTVDGRVTLDVISLMHEIGMIDRSDVECDRFRPIRKALEHHHVCSKLMEIVDIKEGDGEGPQTDVWVDIWGHKFAKLIEERNLKSAKWIAKTFANTDIYGAQDIIYMHGIKS